MDRAKTIFGNEIPQTAYKSSCKKALRFKKRFGDDSGTKYTLMPKENRILAPLNTRELVLTDGDGMLFEENAVIVANIRMGYGHYRIAMAICSCANALGYAPYWFDLNSFPSSTATKIISSQNDLYSMGSRLSQKFSLFNKLVWEPLNSEGFRKLTYNSADQKCAELMTPLFANIPSDISYLGTHPWTSQAAVHAGLSRVVNVIPDNWPMALNLAEGSIHTAQTPSAYLGYKMLRGMDKKRALKPMPEGSIFYTGHYIDHEFCVNIDSDCDARLRRKANGAPVRYLLSIGGAGAQKALFRDITAHLVPQIRENRAMLLINVGDHRNVWDDLCRDIPELRAISTAHFDDYDAAKAFIEGAENMAGVHVFSDKDIFAAVYMTNLLIRKCDVLLTKPSELAFYPVPKIMIHRVGGHEAWGAIRAAEVGDGTYEVDETRDVLAMIDEITAGKEILASMCDSIITAKNAGIYNGGYEAVKKAVGNRE